MHIQHVIWFRASHLHIKVKWLFDLKNTAGNAALSEALFLREEMQSGRPERVSLSLSLPSPSSHTTPRTYETDITIVDIIHLSPTGSAAICCAGRTRRRSDAGKFWKGMRERERREKKKRKRCCVIVPVQEVYLQQVWLILCVAATHLSIDGKSCNPRLLWFIQRGQNPGYFNSTRFGADDPDTVCHQDTQCSQSSPNRHLSTSALSLYLTKVCRFGQGVTKSEFNNIVAS